MAVASPSFAMPLPTRAQTAQLSSTFREASKQLSLAANFSIQDNIDTGAARGAGLLRSGAAVMDAIAPQLGRLAGQLHSSAQLMMSALGTPSLKGMVNAAISDAQTAASAVAALPTQD